MNQPPTSVKNSGSPLVVAVGASAGGLDAFQELLSSIGDAPHMALVFVQHLDSTTKSLLAELLSKTTPLGIVEITGRCKLKASTVYICPPQTLLDLNHGFVSIANEGSDQRLASSIDHFFHAVAEDQGERGVGVILSGTGSDGTLGLKAISDRGGMTFAQEPTSAKYDSMPRSAATTGVADHVLTPAEIAAELLQYSQYVVDIEKRGGEDEKRTDVKEAIPLIAERLMEVTQHNFQHYKLNTLSRRIQRRMQVLKTATVSDYLDHLQHREEEVRALFRELLIGVTAFFRDPDAFEALKHNVLPKLFENRDADDCVRIWVAGCANGAEAYTLAILCREVVDEVAKPVCGVQIFATDIDERALGVARAGVFPIGIEEQISPARLKRFFVKRGKKYHVTKEIRELVLFSVHNLISDPPFSRQDLISCRNLLIYLGPHLQNKLIPLFHYALRPGGYLFLGPSENITSHGELFRPVDVKQRISQRKGTAIGASGASQYRPNQKGTCQGGQLEPDHGADLTEMRQRITLDEFAPKSVVIDENGQILNASPDMQKYLTVNGGNYQNNIVKMAARGLRLGLRVAIAEAKKIQRRVDHEDLSIRIGDQIQRVMVTVQPMPRLGKDEALYMVVFHDIGKPFNREDANSDAPPDSLAADGVVEHSRAVVTFATSTDAMVSQLERELETTRDDLDKTLQDIEAANEELKSSNEELLSMNEELQSANEELETSKEEIRAGSDAIARANADLENLLRSTQIATVFLDDQLLIRSFTPAIEEIYSLISTDVGRPLERFVSDVPNMPPLPNPKLLKDGEPVEHTVVARSGKSFIRRVLPYRSHSGTSEGIVVTFTDVSDLRQSEERFRATFANAAVGIAHVGLDGSWLRVNDRMCEIVGYDRAVLLQKTFQDITHPDDLNHDLAQLQALNSGELDAYTIEKRYFRSEGDVIWIRLTVSAKRDASGRTEYYISIVEDIDRAKRGEIELANAKARLELLLEVANIAPWNWDMRTGDIVSNPTLNRLFGFGADAAPRLADLVARIDPTAQSRVSAAIEHSIKTGETYDQEYSIHWPSGEVRHIRARGEARMSDAGEMEDFLGVVVDVTDRKRRELELADRESHLRRVIDNSVNFIGVLDVDGTLLEANATAIKAGGVTREDVIGKKFWDCYWWSHNESTVNQLREAVERIAEGEVVRYDVTVRMAGDTRIIIDFMLAPVFDKDGRVTHLIPSGFDISDRKAVEATLRESEQLVRTLAENSTQAMIMMDDRGYLTYCNQAFLEMVGFADEEIRSQPLHDLIHHHHPDGRPYPMSDCPIDRALPEDFSVRAHEDLFFRKDGSAFPVMCAASPIFRGGVAVATVIEVRDITEQKRWEKDIAGREAHLRRVINNQLGLVGLIDHNGLLLDIDDRSLKIAGLTRNDVIGKHFAECAWWTYDAAVAQSMRETMDRALAGEVVRYDVPIYGGGLSGPDGRLMIDFMLAPVFDNDSRVEFLIPSGVDISERHAAEQALKKTEQILRIGMEVAKFGVANIDYRTDTVELSKEASALYGLGDREVVVRRSEIHDLVYDEDRAELVRRTKACFEGG